MITIDGSVLVWAGTTIAAIAGGAFGGRKLPIIRNGKNVVNTCPDPDCHNEVMSTSQAISELKTDFSRFKEDIYPKINKTAEDVSKIEGYLKGLANGKEHEYWRP